MIEQVGICAFCRTNIFYNFEEERPEFEDNSGNCLHVLDPDDLRERREET